MIQGVIYMDTIAEYIRYSSLSEAYRRLRYYLLRL